MTIQLCEVDILTLTDYPARDHPYETAWALTPTVNPDVAPDSRHYRLEIWAPDPEHPGEGICIARLSDGIGPRYGKGSGFELRKISLNVDDNDTRIFYRNNRI